MTWKSKSNKPFPPKLLLIVIFFTRATERKLQVISELHLLRAGLSGPLVGGARSKFLVSSQVYILSCS